MASVGSALGIGSGLELGTLLSNLMAAEKIPLAKLQRQEAGVQNKVSAYGQLRSSLSSLLDAVKSLTSTKFNGASGASSDSSVATLSATNAALKASYALEVKTLALAEKAVSAALPDAGSAIAAGTLTFTFGKVDNGSFVANDSEAKTITIHAGNGTLEGMREAINKADAGVTATLVNDGSGTRLVFTAVKTGADQTFSITSTEAPDGIGIPMSFFDYNPASSPAYDSTNPATSTSRLQTAGDAEFTVDGLSITHSSNMVEDAIEGVTLTLTKLGTSRISVSNNPSAARAAAQSLVTAFNGFLSQANALSLNTPSTVLGEAGSTGPLAGDSLIRDVLARIRSEVFTPVQGASGAYTSLSSIGISFQADGSLLLDTDRFDKAMTSNAASIAKLFDTEPFGVGSIGITERFSAQLDRLINDDGAIDARVDGLNTTSKQLQDQQKQLANRLTQIEARYRQQFTTLDTLLSGLNSTSAFLTQQLDALANLRSK